MNTNLGQVVLVKDINPGTRENYYSFTEEFYIGNFIEFEDRLYFTANDGENGIELWVSDGTPEGTQLFKDIYPGSDNGNGSYENHLTEFNDRLYFTADDGENGRELWVSDGTTQGTQLLKDINSINNEILVGSYPSYLTEFDDRLYFSAGDGENGSELWVSDGTTQGTQLLKDIYPGADNYPIGSNTYDVYSSFPRNFTEFGDRLYFAAANAENGIELWVTDGTPQGTELLKDIYPGGGNGNNDSFPQNFTEFDDRLYFTADDGENGKELWVTDGTTQGTQLLKDIYPGNIYSYSYNYYDGSRNDYYFPAYSEPTNFIEFNGRLYFTANSAADDGEIGYELWVSDGTPQGTQLFKDIHPGDGLNTSSYPDNFIEFDDRLYFTANNGHDGGNGEELWVSDGTPQGTQLFKDINPGSDSSLITNLTIFNHKLYFAANDGENGEELWVSDGTPQGTQLVDNINSQVNSFGDDRGASIDNLTVVGDELFFIADNGETGRELFKLTFDDSDLNITHILGTNLADNLIGDAGTDRIEGLIGEDTLNGKAGNDILDGGADNDILFGDAGNDTLTGGDGNDILRGQSGNDILNGDAGDDTLYGGNQFDRLNGGNGDDILDGAGGITIYNGGVGSDLFVIHNDSQTDWITDFELGVDTIKLADSMVFDELEITGRVNSFISLQGEQIGVLLGVNPDDLDASYFSSYES